MENFSPLFEKENQSENYLLWESIILALFENFKFNYEILGTLPSPEEKKDVHPYFFLSKLPGYQEKEYYFDEKNHVHFNSFFGYGNRNTAYPMAKSMAFHHFTYETYQFVWGTPLIYVSNWQETFPLLFSIENNYFLESCNCTFLEDDRYLKDQQYPILHPQHNKYFSLEYFKRLEIPASLLIKNFSIKEINIANQIIKTLNFCLRIFQVALLIQSALMEIFSNSNNKQEQINYLLENWGYPNGKKIKDLSLSRLNILSFLYLSLHPAATALCYGLYRNKYGVINSHRTAFYVKYKNEVIALKDFLKDQVQEYINLLNEYLLKSAPNENLLKEIKEKINAALDLARMYGIGYETNQEKGINIHKNSPQKFSLSKISDSLTDINFIVEHDINSPFWKIFYDYCGEWWNKEEIDQILIGKGHHWERLKNSPRSLAVHIFHQFAANFWKENLKNFNFSENLTNHIEKTYQKILS